MSIKRLITISAILLMITTAFIGYGLLRTPQDLNPSAMAYMSNTANNSNQVLPVSNQSPIYASGSFQTGPTPTPLAPDVLVQARAAEQLFINLYQRINPSVVNIEVVGNFSGIEAIESSGSGFVYDQLGHIVTNAHVVMGAQELLVTFSDGFVTPAEIVGLDEYSDLAVIKVKVDASRLLPVELGDSDDIMVGQTVIAIGNPFGLRSSMTTGMISATGRTLDSQLLISPTVGTQGTYSNPAIIQIDATVNPGNSGGPILNLNGQVIGVATAIRSESGIFQGVAYAVPVNTVHVSVPQLIERGRVDYPRLGITSQLDTQAGLSIAAVYQDLRLPVGQGVLIDQVLADSPAAAAGLRASSSANAVIVRGVRINTGGDIIVAIDGNYVANIDELLEYLIHHTRPGQTVTLTVIRNSETLQIPLVLGTR